MDPENHPLASGPVTEDGADTLVGSSKVPKRASTKRPIRPRRRRWRWLALGLVLLLGVGGFLYYWFMMRPYESTDDAFIDTNITPIAPQVGGEVVSLLVRDNQQVNQGQELLQIDPRAYQARLAQAQAGLTASQTKLDQARAQVSLDEARVTQAQAQLTSAETEAQRAEADLKRYQSLTGPAVSRSQLDLAAAQARSTAAAVEVARSMVKAADAEVALSKAGIQAARADLAANQAVVQQAELALSYTKVTAPVDGYVSHRSVELGAYVQAGQDLLAVVPSHVWVTANFKETQLTDIRPGQPATIKVDAYPDHPFKGHVDSIQRGSGAVFSLLPPENASGNYVKVVQRVPVKIVLDEASPSLPLGPGMSVVPTVNVLTNPHGLQGEEARK